MELKELPKHLVIVGGGYIGLEFASIYASFGSKVTVIETFDRIAGREDEDISKSIKEILEKKGIEFLLGSKVKSLEEIHGEVEVSYENSLGELKMCIRDRMSEVRDLEKLNSDLLLLSKEDIDNSVNILSFELDVYKRQS